MLNTFMLALYVGSALFLAVFGLGLGLVIRDTRRGEGRWGVNLQEVDCPGCGATGAEWRMPASGREALWGGNTCRKCDISYDKWGVQTSSAPPSAGAN